jgi:hypothetical protein
MITLLAYIQNAQFFGVPVYKSFIALHVCIPTKLLHAFISTLRAPSLPRDFLGGKVRPARNADNSAVLLVPNVKVRT